MGIVGAPGKGEQSRGPHADGPFANVKNGPWDDIFTALPQYLQEDYQEYDPEYVPPDQRPQSEESSIGEPLVDVPMVAPEPNLSVEISDEIAAADEADAAAAPVASTPALRCVSDQSRDDRSGHQEPKQKLPANFTYWRKEPLPPHIRPKGP
ncbi:MAG: hypothetical protein AAFY56_13770 [Pseudomonadota bacterium]